MQHACWINSLEGICVVEMQICEETHKQALNLEHIYQNETGLSSNKITLVKKVIQCILHEEEKVRLRIVTCMVQPCSAGERQEIKAMLGIGRAVSTIQRSGWMHTHHINKASKQEGRQGALLRGSHRLIF